MATKWYAGSDHAGFALKRMLVSRLRELGDEVVDVGSADPDLAADIGRRIAAEPSARGLLVCASGVTESIAANDVPGVRCALVHDQYSAAVARSHTDANVVALGSRVVGGSVAESALEAFRATEFEAGRHVRRSRGTAPPDVGGAEARGDAAFLVQPSELDRN